MYKFSKLLFKNILFGLSYIAGLTVIILVLLTAYTSQQVDTHQQAIKVISKHLAQEHAKNQTIKNKYKSQQALTLDIQPQFYVESGQVSPQKPKEKNDTDKVANKEVASDLASLLKASNDYRTLTIKHKNTELYRFESETTSPWDVLLLTRQTVSAANLPLQIQYQLDFSGLTHFLTMVYGGILALTLLCIFIATTLNYKLQTVIFKIISKQISNELAHINDSDFITQNTDSSNNIEIPALKDGIAEIKSLMTEQFKNTSSLEAEAHLDNLTGLENRNVFVQFYENQIITDSSTNFGVLLIIRCSELQTINQVHGYNSGDNYIIKVSEILKSQLVTFGDSKLFRLNSSDFAIILPNEKLKIAEDLAEQLTIKFNDYQQIAELESVAFTGLVYFDESKPLGELLALADTGVSVAQTKATNSWYSQKDVDILADTSANFGSQNWRQEIDSVLEGRRIRLLIQPILPSGRNNKVYGEVLARFLNVNEDMLPTSTFIAMAEKLDKIVAIDQLIIETVINEITSKNMLEHSYGINISSRSINDEHFMIWLERKLLREPSAATRLVFEIAEFGLVQNIKNAKRLVEVLHRVGSRVTVEHFGVGLTSFKFFRDLTPDYIKMDSSYTRDIDDDKNNQYFLRLMIDLAHRLGISVLAESVESQEEKHTLEKLFIDGCQGYYVGRPSQLS